MAKRTKTFLKRYKKLDAHARHNIILGFSAIFIAVLAGLVLMLTIIPKVTNDMRFNRINEIYSSINLPENTYFNREDIFADKRPYEYDTSRTMASSKSFVVARTVTDTAKIIDASIKDAGYTFFEESYPGSTSKEYHYKTKRGEYIRLNVSSKLRDDAASNEQLMSGGFSASFYKIDPNAGPASVTLKVNLDDNNE
jgi:hypothetical protein